MRLEAEPVELPLDVPAMLPVDPPVEPPVDVAPTVPVDVPLLPIPPDELPVVGPGPPEDEPDVELDEQADRTITAETRSAEEVRFIRA
jgi:hypothetical protein